MAPSPQSLGLRTRGFPTPPTPTRSTRSFSLLSSKTTPASSPTPSSIWNEQLPRLEDCFKRAILRHCRPLAIYVDQAKVYSSKQLDTTCASLGIQRLLGTPYYPEGRGKIECFFHFAQSDLLPELAKSSVANLALLNESLLALCCTPSTVPGSKSSIIARSTPKPVSPPRTSPPKRRTHHPACRPHPTPPGLPSPRPAQGHQNRHLFLPGQSLSRRRLSTRPNHQAPLRPLRPGPY